MIDLHLHLDGSLSEELIRRLAARERISIEGALFRAPQDCQDLNDYLRCFDLPLQLLQTPENLQEAVVDLAGRLHSQGIQYAEIRFAPQLHTRRMTQRQAVESVCAIRGLLPIPIQYILCCMRGSDNQADNMETVRIASRFLGHGVCALDLAGAEGLYPTSGYRSLFQAAREARVPFTIHAGEAAGAESIREALSFGASRIGHGVRLAEDPSLLDEIRSRRIPLEMCPTSNLQTHAVSSLSQYPLRRYLRQGLCVTVNTDNMTVSDTTLAREFALLALTDAETGQLRRNAIEAAFLPESAKNDLRNLL